MSPAVADYLIPILEIIWIDILLSGDNAVVIALACAGLPREQRRRGILYGAGAAIGLRVIFTLIFVRLLGVPFVNGVGGLLLLWIAIKLARDERGEKHVKEQTSILAAVRVIVIADAVMSLDNVVAIAAASKGSVLLVVLGLGLSIPLIIFGSSVLLSLITRFPILIWAGAAMLGFIAGGMIAQELASAGPPLSDFAMLHWPYFKLACETAGSAFVVAAALLLPRKKKRSE